MAVRFERKRFQLNGYSASEMTVVATVLRNSIEQRILRAQDLADGPAAPLKQPKGRVTQINGKRAFMRGYPFQKTKKGKKPVRDWFYTGELLRNMQVLSARRNRAVIGFADPLSNLKASVNNRRWRQFGVSPRNQAAMMQAFSNLRNPVSVVAA